MAGQDYVAWSFADLGFLGTAGTLDVTDTFTVDISATSDVLTVDDTGAEQTPTDFLTTGEEPDQVVSGTLDGATLTNVVHQYELAWQIEDSSGNIITLYWVNTGINTVGGDGPNFHNDGFFVTEGGPLVAGETYTILAVDVSVNFDNGTAFETAPAYGDFFLCFTAGTLIETRAGLIAVEDLKVGDAVKTLDNGFQTLRWIGQRRVAAEAKFAPVCIKKGMIGNNRDLVVSPQHRVMLTDPIAELMFGESDVLVAAKHLTCSDQAYVVEGGEVEYFHLLFDAHEIIFAEGAASESFHPGVGAMSVLAPETRNEVLELFPELKDNPQAYHSNPRRDLKAHEAAVLLAH